MSSVPHRKRLVAASTEPAAGRGNSFEVPAPEGAVPSIMCSGRQLPEIVTDALCALRLHSSSRSLFIRGGVLVEVLRDERGRHVVRELLFDAMRGIVARAAHFFQAGTHGHIPCFPPKEVVQDLLALTPGQLGFPRLEGVIEAPALRPDGTIIVIPGYDQATGLYYAPDPNLRVPDIPAQPTFDQVLESFCQILDITEQFPYSDEASMTNAVATMLTPIVRPAITGPTPLALIDAPSPGTGKTLFAEIVSLIATGCDAALYSAPGTGDEWRKALTAVLRDGAQVVIIDNVCAPLESPELSKALTSRCWADRILGHSRTVHLPVRCTWIANGNNLKLDGDLPRRCYLARMDAKVSEPWKRTGFKYPDLKAHVLEHQGELLASLLTLARAWFVAGCPPSIVMPLGSYESWTIITGGILEYAGFKGFLANSDEMQSQLDEESPQWEFFLFALDDTFGDAGFMTSDVFRVCEDPNSSVRRCLPDFVAEFVGQDGKFQRRLGRELRDRRGGRFGQSQVYVERAGTEHSAARWRVRKGS